MSKRTEAVIDATPIVVVGARMAAKARRQQIVRIAIGLFSQRGFRGTTTKEIAQAAGVSEAIIYRHFATKDELYAAILDNKVCAGRTIDPGDKLSEAMKRKDDHAVFEIFARAALEYHASDTDFIRLLLFSALERHELARMFGERNACGMYEILGNYIRERQREGALKGNDPMIVVRAFTGMLFHHSLISLLEDRSHCMLNISHEDAAREFTKILLDGITRRKSETREIEIPARGETTRRMKDSHQKKKQP